MVRFARGIRPRGRPAGAAAFRHHFHGQRYGRPQSIRRSQQQLRGSPAEFPVRLPEPEQSGRQPRRIDAEAAHPNVRSDAAAQIPQDGGQLVAEPFGGDQPGARRVGRAHDRPNPVGDVGGGGVPLPQEQLERFEAARRRRFPVSFSPFPQGARRQVEAEVSDPAAAPRELLRRRPGSRAVGLRDEAAAERGRVQAVRRPVDHHAGGVPDRRGQLRRPDRLPGEGRVGRYDEPVDSPVREGFHRPELLFGVEAAGGKQHAAVGRRQRLLDPAHGAAHEVFEHVGEEHADGAGALAVEAPGEEVGLPAERLGGRAHPVGGRGRYPVALGVPPEDRGDGGAGKAAGGGDGVDSGFVWFHAVPVQHGSTTFGARQAEEIRGRHRQAAGAWLRRAPSGALPSPPPARAIAPVPGALDSIFDSVVCLSGLTVLIVWRKSLSNSVGRCSRASPLPGGLSADAMNALRSPCRFPESLRK